MAHLDPDRSWEYRFRIWIQDGQNGVQEGEKFRDFKMELESSPSWRMVDGYYLSLEVPYQGL